MSDPRVPLKNPFVAAVLAFLIPGAGHFYQGRIFKALIYSVCILGAFFYGMHMSEWKAVNLSADPNKRNLGYYAQAATGLPALYAIVQAGRYRDEENKPQKTLTAPLSAPFTGTLEDPHEDPISITGRIELEPGKNPQNAVTGTFQGTDPNGNAIELELGGNDFKLAPPVGGNPGRSLRCDVVNPDLAKLRGEIPRKFADWFEAPLSDDEVQDVNRRLGKRYELALVYTWIAGLLNILAIWDALEGPAYGYGDEDDEEDEAEKKKRNKPQEQPQPSLEATARP